MLFRHACARHACPALIWTAGHLLVRSVEDSTDNSDLRWMVDEERDFMLVHRLYDQLDLG